MVIMGIAFPASRLHELFRDRILKISQCEMAALFGMRQPNISAHESGDASKWSDRAAAAYESLGFHMWIDHAVTSEDELNMLREMVEEDSGAEYMPSAYAERLRSIRAAWKRNGA